MEKYKFYAIENVQISKLRELAKRLYTENRMNGDEMRNAAQLIDSILDSVEMLDLEGY